MHRGELLLQFGDGLGVADAGHHVLALGVDQEVAVGPLGPGGRVAGEADAGARVVVAVAEDHGLHVDGGAQVVGDALAVRGRRWPGGRSSSGRPPRWRRAAGRRVLGERRAGVALDDLLVGVDQVAQQLGRHLGVRGGAGQLLGRVEEGVELLAGQLEHDAPVHGDEAAVGVEGEPLVARSAWPGPRPSGRSGPGSRRCPSCRAWRTWRPERTETSSGSSASPITLPMAASRRRAGPRPPRRRGSWAIRRPCSPGRRRSRW